MTTASPSFSFAGVVTPLAKNTVAASTSFSATLDDITGITSVAWSVVSTDETSLPGTYSLSTSGIKGSTVRLTSLGLGTAGVLSCTVNGGIDPQTDQSSPAMTATALFEVLLANGGSVGVVGETTQRDGVFGSLVFLNQMARLLDATAVMLGTPDTEPTPGTIAVRGTNAQLKALRFEQGTGSAQSGSVRLLDGASVKMRTADTFSDANVISQSAETLTVGDAGHTAALQLIAETVSGSISAKVGATTLVQITNNGIQLGGTADLGSGSGVVGLVKATTNPSTNPVHGFVLYVDSATGVLTARGAAGTVTPLAVP